MYCNNSSGMAICTAVAIAEQAAESVSIQRHQLSHPPTQNVNSAALAERPARQFSGKSAQSATFVHIANLVQRLSITGVK
jgi:hypothetical protein